VRKSAVEQWEGQYKGRLKGNRKWEIRRSQKIYNTSIYVFVQFYTSYSAIGERPEVGLPLLGK
jgi:hypothetical protein